jgi:glucosamine--fructose-6-phosphate aminotransferase (isomerizing)
MNHFEAHIKSLPDKIPVLVSALASNTQGLFQQSEYRNIRRIYLVGCGDSYHASLGANFIFQQLTGIPCWSLTAMTFSRYCSGDLPGDPEKILVVGVSSSGQVSRTIEALDLANNVGALSLAITSRLDSPLANVAARVLHIPKIDSANDSPGLVLPGAFSYLASLVSLYLLAIRCSTESGRISKKKEAELILNLGDTSDAIGETIQLCDKVAQKAAQDWKQAAQFIYCGAGPNYGTALFSAAKMIEASGVAATGQDLEEWAHIEYFGRKETVPTIVISAADRDYDRALEILVAAHTIGRDVALVAPISVASDEISKSVRHFPIAEPVREGFSNLLTPIPGMLLAAYHSDLIAEKYFRGFGGGRSKEGGGGISRIQTSNRLHDIRRK